MYIKRVTVNNFKSYRSRTVADNLGPGINVFLGRNGAGKSNFFQAIEFVVKRSRELRKYKRLALNAERSFEGNIYAEILFEDCDDVFGGKIALRWVLYDRTEEYFVNSKRTSRQNALCLLELLGFCHKTPIYCLNNNLMKSFISMKAEERLEIIINNFGASISETLEILLKSLYFLEDLKEKILKYQDHLKETHVSYVIDLSEEKTKWKKFIKLNKEKAAIIVQRHEHFVKFWETQIKEIKQKQLEDEVKMKKTYEYRTNYTKMTTVKAQLQDTQQMISTTKNLLEDSINERIQLMKKQEKLDLNLKDLENEIVSKRGSLTLEPKIDRQDKIKILTETLSKEENIYTKELIDLKETKDALMDKEQRRINLITRIGRKRKFSNEKSRNNWLQVEISKMSTKINETEKNINDFLGRKSDLENMKSTLINQIFQLEQEEKGFDEKKTEEEEKKIIYSKLQIKLNEAYRKENILQHDIETLKKALLYRAGELRMKLGRGVVEGMESVNYILTMWKNKNDPYYIDLCDRYFGILLESFKCDDGFNVALDAASGKKLFFHIISDDRVGMRILQEMNSLNLPGEVWFIPLNRILVKQPKLSSDELGQPLINQLQFGEDVVKAMIFCFGNVMICRDLETAVQIAKRDNCICVTLSGDRVDPKGVMNGGYRETKKTFRSFYQSMTSNDTKLSEKLKKSQSTKNEITNLQQQIDSVLSDLQKLKTKISSPRGSVTKLNKRIKEIDEESKKFETEITKKKELIAQYTSCKSDLIFEMSEQFSRDCTEETKEIKHLNKTINDLTKHLNTQQTSVIETEGKISEIKYELGKCLNFELQLKTDQQELQRWERKFQSNITEKNLIIERLVLLDKRIETAEEKIISGYRSEEKYKKEIENCEQQIDEYNFTKQSLDDTINVEKIKILESKINDSRLKIQQVMGKYKDLDLLHLNDLTLEKLNKEFLVVNRKIKALGVIKYKSDKAAEANLINKLQLLAEQMIQDCSYEFVELTDFKDWIEEHIKKSLDNISHRFKHYFNLLTPNSSANLVLEEKEDEDIWPLKGISINITTSGDLDISDPSILSGSQQTNLLISFALALTESQKLPFCTLDEMDQFMSPTTIDTFVALLKELGGIQFLATSHRQDFIKLGRQFYLVFYRNNKSHILQLDPNGDSSIVEQLIEFCRKDSICAPEDSSIFSISV